MDELTPAAGSAFAAWVAASRVAGRSDAMAAARGAMHASIAATTFTGLAAGGRRLRLDRRLVLAVALGALALALLLRILLGGGSGSGAHHARATIPGHRAPAVAIHGNLGNDEIEPPAVPPPPVPTSATPQSPSRGAVAAVVAATPVRQPVSPRPTNAPGLPGPPVTMWTASAGATAVSGGAALPGAGWQAVGPLAPAAVTAHTGDGTQVEHAETTSQDAPAVGPAFLHVVGAQDDAQAALGAGAPSSGCRSANPLVTAARLVGGSACSSVSEVSALTGVLGTAQLQASGVVAQSTTGGCLAGSSEGWASIASLRIAGQDVIGGGSSLLGTNTPPPNSAYDLGPFHVVLNEQTRDAGGNGLTVTAIHVTSASGVDILIAHVHSSAVCVAAAAHPTATTPSTSALAMNAQNPAARPRNHTTVAKR